MTVPILALAFLAMIVIKLVTLKGAAKHELLFKGGVIEHQSDFISTTKCDQNHIIWHLQICTHLKLELSIIF
jgi:hypothetical protein